jgi:hypothetical protein
MAVADFFWPCGDRSVGPYDTCIIRENLPHGCRIELFPIQGREVAVDHFSDGNLMQELILVIHVTSRPLYLHYGTVPTIANEPRGGRLSAASAPFAC